MKVKIKKLSPEAIIPTYSKNGDACLDLTATWVKQDNKYIEYGTGLAVEIPEGYFGLVRPRSSISKTDLLFNTSGIVDSGYRGELTVRFKVERQYHLNFSSVELVQIGYDRFAKDLPKVGDRIAQFMILPYPLIDFVEVNELSETERGIGGHGSTGV